MKHNLNKEPKETESFGLWISRCRSTQERSSGRYQARITVDGKLTGLGTFDTANEAARVFDKAILKYNLLIVKLNFSPQTTNDIQIKEEPKDDQISSNSQWV